MIIFLGIVGELATVVGSVAITLNAGIDSILEISKNGYKIDKSVLDEVQKKQAEKKKQKTSLGNKVLGTTLLLVPGVNLINASIKGAKLKKSVMNDPQVKEAIVPMTEQEKEQYAEMEGKLQKLAFTAFTSGKEKEEEFLGFFGKKPIAVDHGLISLYCEELMPLDYTLDEVKRLNEATTYSYRVGNIDDRNVAVIGIPNPESPVSRIQFKAEDFKITHSYKEMTDEEAQDKTFRVYPFMIYDDTQAAAVEKVFREIEQSRIDGAVKANLEALRGLNGIMQDYIPIQTEEVPSEEQQGPELKRELK